MSTRARKFKSPPPPAPRRPPWAWALAAAAVGAAALALWPRGPGIEGLQTVGGLSRAHTEGAVSYPQAPPLGGRHASAWQNCGVYDQPVPSEAAVHSLEHGAAWLAYRPDLGSAEVERLRGLVRGRAYALLSPYPGLPAPVVAAAWGVRLEARGVDDPRLARFVARRRPRTAPRARASAAPGLDPST